MPPKRNQNNKGKTRRTRRSGPAKSGKGAAFSGHFGNSVIPGETRCKMHYAFIGTLAAATSFQEIAWSVTNLSDPGGGTDTRQPVGYDEMALWYTNYRLHKANFLVKANLASTSATPTSTTMGADIVVYATSASGALTLLTSALCQPNAQFRRLSAQNIAVIDHHVDFNKQMGQRGVGMDNSVGTTASGPTAFNLAWRLGLTADVAYTSVNIEYNILITYDVTFFNRKLLEIPTFQSHMFRFIKENEYKWLADAPPTKPQEVLKQGEHKSELVVESKAVPPKQPVVVQYDIEDTPTPKSLGNGKLVLPTEQGKKLGNRWALV